MNTNKKQTKIKSQNNKRLRRSPRMPPVMKMHNNNAFSKVGTFHTMSRISNSVSIPLTATAFRVDIIPNLALFPL